MKLQTACVDCLPCIYYQEVSRVKGRCLKRNRDYWIGAKIQCDDMEVMDFGDKDKEDEHSREDSDEGE